MTEDLIPGSTSVSTLIGAPVVGVAPDASLHEVADAMVAAGVGALIVTHGNGDGPAGIVSERDIVRALAARRDPGTTQARDIANTTLVWCDAQASVTDVAGRMMECYIRHVLVEDGGDLVGIVSARDLLGDYVSGSVDIERE
jgi:CBS domain-containing protein